MVSFLQANDQSGDQYYNPVKYWNNESNEITQIIKSLRWFDSRRPSKYPW